MNFFAENLRVAKTLFLPLFVLLVLYTNLEQYLNVNLESLLRSTQGTQQAILLWGGFSVAVNLFFPLLLLTLSLFVLNRVLIHQPQSGTEFFNRHFSLLTIETLRSWGKILLWSLVFIVPGFWKYIQYLLVPFVVTSDPSYQLGEVDALERSRDLVKKNLGKIFLFLILFALFFPLLLTGLFSSYRLIWKTPLASLTLSLLDTYIFILSTHILFNIFRKEALAYESHV